MGIGKMGIGIYSIKLILNSIISHVMLTQYLLSDNSSVNSVLLEVFFNALSTKRTANDLPSSVTLATLCTLE